MAEAFLKVVVDNLSSLMKEQIGLIVGADKETEKLHSTLTTIQAVLQDAEMKQLQSVAIQNWLIKLTDLAYEIDDILDECSMQVLKSKHSNCFNNILFRHKIGRKMKRVIEKLDAVAAEKEKFHLRVMDVNMEGPITAFAATRETSSFLSDEHPIYGRDEEKEEIVDVLLNHSQQLCVLPIIGLGGLGKTTLAQATFNDPRLNMRHFDLKLWVCVSDNFDHKTLVKAMIESAGGTASDLEHLEALECRLRDLLNQKRYLLVLDDVWNEDQEKWSKLRNVLGCGSMGSSIVVTTRMRKIGEIVGTHPAINLKELSEDYCWMLLKKRAFGQGEEEQYQNLEDIGKQIVKKCGGVPLAAKALGGLLRFKRTEEEWNHVKESELWNLPQEETSILPALRLSYQHLPLAMRQCFAYCAIFPKDSMIYKDELIYSWMAHGYISSNGTLDVEDVGNYTCNELVVRSIFQNAIHDKTGNTFTMHDLVHDLALSIMKTKVSGTSLASKSQVREVKNIYSHFVGFPMLSQVEIDNFSNITKYCSLRMFRWRWLQGSNGFTLSTLGKLKHLRYLNLSEPNISKLPNSICSLWNLRTLILNVTRIQDFPKKMRHLKNLRDLFLEHCTELKKTPYKVSDLTSLRNLSVFIVGKNRGYNITELEELKLVGSLEIRNLDRVENESDAKKANLVGKQKLRWLSLRWECKKDASTSIKQDRDEKVLEALQPHPNLESLKISGFNGRHFPCWMENTTLLNLAQVELRNCQNLEYLRNLEVLPQLKELRLRNLAHVD